MRLSTCEVDSVSHCFTKHCLRGRACLVAVCCFVLYDAKIQQFSASHSIVLLYKHGIVQLTMLGYFIQRPLSMCSLIGLSSLLSLVGSELCFPKVTISSNLPVRILCRKDACY